jgi:DNA-binding MarR family transcriptional regulator
VSERLKVRGSLARRALLELEEKGLIRKVRIPVFSIIQISLVTFFFWPALQIF